MSRNVKPGITFYRMDSGHVLNKKVRLLFNEFQSDGYYIWSCLLDYAYNKWGYYFDMNDPEELELFASEYCRMRLTKIQEVITGCIRRGLFDKAVSESFGVLTSAMMQEVFIYATSDRRKKGSQFEMQKDWLLIQMDKIPENLILVPGKNNENPVKIPQTRQDNTETKQNNTVAAGTPPPVPLVKKLVKKKPVNTDEPEPFWNELVQVWFDFGKEKFNGEQPSFAGQDPKIFKRIIHLLKKRAAANNAVWDERSAPVRLRLFLDTAWSDEWLSKHFLLCNLEKQFDTFIQNQRKASEEKKKIGGAVPLPAVDQKIAKELEYLFERYLENAVTVVSIEEQHYTYLNKNKLIGFAPMVVGEIINNANRYMEQKGYEWTQETQNKYSKKFAVLEYFKQKAAQEKEKTV